MATPVTQAAASLHRQGDRDQFEALLRLATQSAALAARAAPAAAERAALMVAVSLALADRTDDAHAYLITGGHSTLTFQAAVERHRLRDALQAIESRAVPTPGLGISMRSSYIHTSIGAPCKL